MFLKMWRATLMMWGISAMALDWFLIQSRLDVPEGQMTNVTAPVTPHLSSFLASLVMNCLNAFFKLMGVYCLQIE